MAKIEENIINNSTPEELKKEGTQILVDLLTKQSLIFANRMIPALEKEIVKFEEGCPTKEELNKAITLRNNVAQQANNIASVLKSITFATNLTKLGINTLLNLIKALKTAKITVSLASKFIPVIPGSVTSALSDLDDLITNKTFDIEGNSKITPVKSAVNSISVPIALMSFYIENFIRVISSLDENIEKCQPNLQLTPISEELVEIGLTQQQAQESPNLSTYQGFIFEIEEVPFSPTVNRRRALGKNSDGITLIQTELSFTTSEQVLIDELKLKIDRDNLRAN